MIVDANMTKLTLVLCILVTGFLTGCVSPTDTAPPPPARPVTAAGVNYDAAFSAAADTLTEYKFRIDRVDRRAGMIETFPLTGKSWLEPWRADGATMRDITESTLQTIYRTATVHVIPDGVDTYRVWVRVAVARANRPGLRITNTSQAYHLFQLERGRLRGRRAMGRAWRRTDPVPLDDDLVLAMFIRRDIEQRLVQR